jgi:hypothetical protein
MATDKSTNANAPRQLPLVELGKRFEEALPRWRQLLRKYNDDRRSAAFDDAIADSGLGELLAQITEARASSIPELVVKAQAAAWYWENDPDFHAAMEGDYGETDLDALQGVVADLLNIHAGPDWLNKVRFAPTDREHGGVGRGTRGGATVAAVLWRPADISGQGRAEGARAAGKEAKGAD